MFVLCNAGEHTCANHSIACTYCYRLTIDECCSYPASVCLEAVKHGSTGSCLPVHMGSKVLHHK